MRDERIEQAKNKIRSEIAVVIYITIAVSFMVKTLFLKMSLEECITEYLILIFFPVYEVIRMNMLKVSRFNVYPKRGNRQTMLVMIIAFGVVTLAAVGFPLTKESTVKISYSSVLFLLIFFVSFVGISLIVRKYHQDRAIKYEKEFDDNEPED